MPTPKKKITISIDEETLRRLEALRDLVGAKNRNVAASAAINFLYYATNKPRINDENEGNMIIENVKIPTADFETMKFFHRIIK